MRYYGYVYKIACKLNGKCYVGQTIISVEDRWRRHKYAANRRGFKNKMLISKAICKYGIENFEITTVCKANNQQELNHRERLAIRLFKCLKNGYNLKEGGSDSKITLEIRAKMSKAGKGKKKPKGFGEKIRQANIGKKRSKSACLAMSKAQTEGQFWKGKKHSTETKLKMSSANKGKKKTLEHIEKHRQSILGTKASVETKLKMSAKRLGRTPSAKKIICTTNGNVYSSLKEASIILNISINSLQHHLKGKLKSAQGYCFKYL